MVICDTVHSGVWSKAVFCLLFAARHWLLCALVLEGRSAMMRIHLVTAGLRSKIRAGNNKVKENPGFVQDLQPFKPVRDSSAAHAGNLLCDFAGVG